MFVQENIEKLKQQWTDKYVVVAGSRPELRRFEGYTGQVKTVNMSGRALVQFDAWSNIGWYDIDLGYLEVVPKPDPNEAGKKVEAKSEAAPKAEAKAEAKPAAKPADGKMSVAEMLAAARASKPGAASTAPAAKPQAAKQAAKETPTPPKAAGGKLSTADILAAARAKQATELPAADAVEKAPVATAPVKPQAAKVANGSTALPKGQRPTVAQMLAYCREHDTKG